MLRLLSDRHDTGPAHMCLDEALLDCAEVATIRIYTWSPATVSLGYFQDHDTIRAQLPAEVPIVRRITGGGAIWHDQELTYALIARPGYELPERSEAAYRQVHTQIHAQLQAAGADLARQQRSVGDRRYRQEPRCFASPAMDDLISATARGGKVLGSAARRRGERLLIHGSLKLASNPWDGTAVTGCGLAAPQARAALITGLAAALGLEAVPDDLTAAESARQRELLALRYADQRWVVDRAGPRP